MKLFHKKITFSLRVKLMLLIEAFVIVLVITIGIITTLQSKNTLLTELHKRGLALASDLAKFAERPLINQDVAGLRRFVNYSMDQDYVEHVIILDNNNKVVMHNDLSEIGKTYETVMDEKKFCSKVNIEGYTHLYSPKEEHCDILMPIKIEDLKLGAIIVRYSHAAAAEEIKGAERLILFIALATTIIGAFVAYLLATFISSPIKKITEATEKLASGNLDVPLNIKSNDEIGILASSFNKMAGDLQTHRTHLESLVEERTADLQAAIKRLKKEIAERELVEKALSENELKYRNLFENSLDAIYISSREGRLVDINQSGIDLFKYTREETTGLDISKLYLNINDRKRFQHEIERKGSVRNYPLKLLKKGGAVMDCLISST
ncbi:MAG: HAMP domain-containing protein, partial [Desulfobacterales bacterium]|nr:HAMP domain-containing protein [Desulfobacterales bacterium]